MNLRWKAFEKPLRVRVKRLDARREMGFWQWVAHLFDCRHDLRFSGSSVHIAAIIRGLFCLFVVGLLAAALRDNTPSPPVIMAAIGSWGLVVVAGRVNLIQAGPGGNAEYRSLWMLPLTPDRILRHLMSSVHFGLACLFLEFLCAYGIVALSCRHSFASLAVCVLCSILQALFSLAVTSLLLTWRVRGEWLSLSAMLFPAASYYIYMALPNPSVRMLVFDFCNPIGWINFSYLHGWIGREPRAFWVLVPVAGVLATFPVSLRTLRRMHHDGCFRKERVPGLPTLTPPTPTAPPPFVTPEELRRELLSANFFQPLPWNERGLIERLLDRVLRPDEIAIARTLLISPPSWSRRLLPAAGCLLSIWLLHALIDFHSLHLLVDRYHWGVFPGVCAVLLNFALFALSIGYACALLRWPVFLSFESRLLTSRNSTLWSLLPLRSFNLWKVSAKINGLIIALILPVAHLFRFSPFGLPTQDGIGFFGKILTVLASCACIFSFPVHRLGRIGPKLSRMIASFASSAPAVLGLFWLGSSSSALDVLAAPALIAGSIGWSYLCGFLELRAWHESAKNSDSNAS